MNSACVPPQMAEDRNGPSTEIAFHWLLQLRWGAFVAQALLLFIAYYFLKFELPYGIIFTILLFEIATNLFFVFLKTKNVTVNHWLFAMVMFLDITLLTFLLYYSGGPMNPFSFLYLVHITLGTVLMRPAWAWALTLFTSLCYASLFYLPAEGSMNQPCHPEPSLLATLSDPMKIHLQGMWVAFAVTAFFIVFFANRIQHALAKQQKTLADLKEEKIKNEKLASLATLAAGAAHEFSTPLATIAIASGEMLHELKACNGSKDLIEDATLIRDQVARCKDILFQMTADAGENLGEELSIFQFDDFVKDLIDKFPAGQKSRIQFTGISDALYVRMPLRTIRRIVRGIVNNALDASPAEGLVRVTTRHDDSRLFLEVTDQGSGMNQTTLSRATEPFFTTKEPGKGMGLGLYLAKTAAERFGGGIEISSTPGKGSKVTIFFALPHVQAGASI